MLGAILGGVGSLISGLGARSSAKKAADRQWNLMKQAITAAGWAEATPHEQWTSTTETNRIDLKRMRDDAEAAGYNPLSALRSGLASGYGISTVDNYMKETGHNAGLSANLTMQAAGINPVQVPSMGSIFGGALSAGASIFNDSQAQLRNISAQQMLQSSYLKGVAGRSAPSSAAHMFGVPSVVQAGSALKKSQDGGGGYLDLPFLGRWNLGPSSPAQKAEDEVGDVAGSAYGIGRILESFGYNLNTPTKKLLWSSNPMDWWDAVSGAAMGAAEKGFNVYNETRKQTPTATEYNRMGWSLR